MDEERLSALRSILGEKAPVSIASPSELSMDVNHVEAPSFSQAPVDVAEGFKSDPENKNDQSRYDALSRPSVAETVLQFFPRLQGISKSMADNRLSQLSSMRQQENWQKEYDLKKKKSDMEEAEFRKKYPSEAEDMESSMTQFGRGLVKNQLDKAGLSKLSPLVDSMNMSQLGAVSDRFKLGDQFRQAMQNYRSELQAKGYESRQSEVNERQFNTLIDAGRRRLESNTKAFRESVITTEDLGEMSRLMREGNTLAASTYAAKYARGVAREVGVLTESDLTRYTNSKQLARKSADIINQWMNGRPTDATIEELNLITQALNEKTQQHIQSFANQEIERMSKSTKRPVEEISDYLGYSYDPSVNAFGKKEKSTSDISKMAIIDTPKGRKTVPRSELKKYLDAGAKLVE